MDTIKKESVNKSKSKLRKLISVVLILLAIAYIIMPIDYDGPIIGYIDDFLLFMSALCFCFSQFANELNSKARYKLDILSLSFCILGFAWLVILACTPILIWVA